MLRQVSTGGVMARRPTGDDAVVAAAKAGDPMAWRSLYEQLGGRLLGWLKSQAHLDGASDADDMASEAWFVAARKISEFSGTADDFAGWLFVIARNLTVNTNRKSLRRGTFSTDLDPREFLPDPGTADEGVDSDAREWTRQLLAQLPKMERDVVAWIDVANLDIAATSKLLGTSRAAVRVAHHRAMKRLRLILASGAVEGRKPGTNESPAGPMGVSI